MGEPFFFQYSVGTGNPPIKGGVRLEDWGKKFVFELKNDIWDKLENELKNFDGVTVPERLNLWLFNESKPQESRLLDEEEELCSVVFPNASKKKVFVTPVDAENCHVGFVVRDTSVALAPVPTVSGAGAGAGALTGPATGALISVRGSGLKYDGFHRSNYMTWRKETVEGIVEKLADERVVLIRGPPQAGKTCLLDLLADYLKSMSNCRVDRLCMRGHENDGSLDNVFMKAFNKTFAMYVEDKSTIKVLMVDEAQLLFDVTKWQSKCLFSHTRVPDQHMMMVFCYVRGCKVSESFQPGLALSPDQLKARPEVRLWGDPDFPYQLALSQDEYDELWNSWLGFCETTKHVWELSDYLKNYVGYICGMQPGLIAPVLDYIHGRLMHGGFPSEMHDKKAVESLTRQSFYMTMEVDIRSFTDLRKRSCKGFLLWLFGQDRDVSSFHAIPPEFKEGAAELYQLGYYAVAENRKVQFVSPLHRMVFLTNHFTPARRNNCILEDFDMDFGDYIMSAVELMDSKTLAKSAGKTAARTRNERVYMDEFYRVGSSLLPSDVVWSPEVGFMFGVKGRVDYICSDLGWFIEGMRDGLNREGHLKRFKQGGAYWRFFELGMVKKWAVLDFGLKKIPFNESAEGFWQIRFDEGFRVADIMSPEGQILKRSLQVAYSMEM
eukprot:TRINITY_DN255_c1_g1_i5.p1 TRINITY_DN255_c1_g1~~TRINITY_DN255_c1_g1_i5.p1  ORF type:complete len:664 (+),score=134.31 TRINITY_DN255_c1_g1_i5:159-2150(+)